MKILALETSAKSVSCAVVEDFGEGLFLLLWGKIPRRSPPPISARG